MPSSQQRKHLSKSKCREIRRRREADKASKTRRQLQENVRLLPASLRSFFSLFAPSFTKPTFLRFTLLAVAAILTTGGSTICNLLRTLGCLAPGDPSSYHRVFSARRWSSWRLGRALAAWIFDHLVGDGPILLAADDTVSEHPGDKVYGKSCHRDAVRSSHSFTAFRWGHKWLVLAVLVRFPETCRFWALPFFVVLCRSEKDDRKERGRHRTPAENLKLILFVLRRWFPERTFLLAADGGFASHDLAEFAGRQQQRLSLVSRFYSAAALYELPPVVVLDAKGKRGGAGRPRVKGAKLDTPEQAVAKAKEKTRLRVSWYGGGERDVEVVTGTGHWYKAGQGLVLVLWVYVNDLTGTHRDEYFFSTDVTMTAKTVIETYARRWNLETTFQEMRSYIGLETTRGWKKETVRRMEPCLFGLYSVVACLFSQLPEAYKQSRGVDWRGKENLTFSDAITGVRKWLWVEWVFEASQQREACEKLPGEFQELILNGLAPSA
jgi:DDE superfamily endonuclease